MLRSWRTLRSGASLRTSSSIIVNRSLVGLHSFRVTACVDTKQTIGVLFRDGITKVTKWSLIPDHMKCVYFGQTSHALSVLRSFCYFKLETSIYMLRFSTVVFRPGTMVNRVVPGFASRFAYSTCFTLISWGLGGVDLSTIMKQTRQKRGRKKRNDEMFGGKWSCLKLYHQLRRDIQWCQEKQAQYNEFHWVSV